MVVESIIAGAVITLFFELTPRGTALLILLAAFLFFLTIGAVKPTAAELAGMGAFLAGFGVLFLCVMKGSEG